MGQIGGLNKEYIKKEYKDILESRDLINDALDFEKRLNAISEKRKKFEKDLETYKN